MAELDLNRISKNTWPRITFKCMPFATSYKQIHSLISDAQSLLLLRLSIPIFTEISIAIQQDYRTLQVNGDVSSLKKFLSLRSGKHIVSIFTSKC